ncbi:hypothetical protein Y88_1586 [Novosphingobium nitrogenifigens DSM 19370]|jgi:flagellar assembly protein FliH|uniref:Flagellar assembly protein FliH n=1 Tax=Novosphingobium nitrogenifigens DSM 19370 TaxID=983920 RepID=F1Z7P0_9SPHN|nr:FliH/SctL family protein [Novosphingobium nitrogenifigens]EGD59431.1 hypothetical protein Y88_1586 [Novosphingobium nitrogenifigens DSM 19370]
MSEGFARLSLAALSARNSRFAPDARFLANVAQMVEPAVPVEEAEPDPVADAYARGYAEGAEAGQSSARAEAAAADAARHRIETALSRMDAQMLDAFGARLRETVLALCESVLGDAAVSPNSLAARVETAASMFTRADDERVIRLHPEDLALIHARLPEDWHCEPDSTLERGSIRVETAQGGVEDGPIQWRRMLEEALRTC